MNDMQHAGAAAPLKVDIAEKTFRSAEGVTIDALRGLSFEVRQGEFACLFGPSGCGKTRTVRSRLGLGQAMYGGYELRKGGCN
nr:ATP-binding cassette domain-containing protein [Rhizobium sp. SEMIA 4085]